MNTLKYKGYLGSVAYSEADQVFYGKIEGIDALVNYEGSSVLELTEAFHEAVEDYLVFCEEKGLMPEKSYTGSFNVRISPQIHRDIARLAAEEGLSLNAYIKKVLSHAVLHPYPQEWATSSYLREGDAEEYGATTLLSLSIPSRDRALAQELADRLGWKCEAKEALQ